MKDTLIQSLLGAGSVKRVCLENNSQHGLNKTKCALEALMNVSRLNKYISTNISNPSKETKNLANIAIESLCQHASVSVNNLSFEDMEQQNTDMANIEDSLQKSLIDNLSRLIPVIYSDITNLSLSSNSMHDRLKALSKSLKEIPTDKMPLVEHLKPETNFAYLYTSKGISLNTVIDAPIKLYDEFISKVDDLVLRVLQWAHNELSLRMRTLDKPFKSHWTSGNFKYPDFPGLVDITISIIEQADGSIPKMIVQLTDKPEAGNLKAELATQNSLSAKEWMDFNKNGRSEKDLTKLRLVSLSDIGILIEKLDRLNSEVVKKRININEQLFINRDEYDKILFTSIMDRLSVDNINDKDYVILSTILDVLMLRAGVDEILTKYCFDVINSLDSLLVKSIEFYKYE